MTVYEFNVVRYAGVLMRHRFLQIAATLLIFALGILCGTLWHSRQNQSNQQPSTTVDSQQSQLANIQEEDEWTLTPEIVSRALQTKIIRTTSLRRNSDDEVVWRWLKQSVTDYHRDWLKLNISETEQYGVVIYPASILSSNELSYCNQQLREQ